jgi:ketose-bisphosphate aldolase
MSYVSMTEMLQTALHEKYAVGAFNVLDYNSMKAVVQAAEELKAPVIVQTSVKTVQFWGFDPMIQWAKELCLSASVPVALHLDHCKDVDFIRECIQKGWSSVMIDASSKPIEENLNLTKQVIQAAKSRSVSVEAEIGAIVGVEDDIHVKEQDAHLADVEQSVKFCQELELDCFAPAIGTAHGIYKGEPKIAFDRLEKIARITGVPIALHGGTGLSDEVFKKCISLGCAKVNISTELKYSFIDSFVRYHQTNPSEYNPLKVLGAQFQDLKKHVKKNIILFGGEGKV